MEKTIILQGISLEAFLNHIDVIVEKRLQDIIEQLNSKQSKFLSRKEVSKLLQISLPTLSVLTKEGVINSYRIGRRVLYKSDEIENAPLKRRFNQERG